MEREQLPKEFVDKCNAVKNKRPRIVIQHILKNGHITTEELREKYGYTHPPRAARDVREVGIALETLRVKGSDGRSIGAYRFKATSGSQYSKLSGRTAFASDLKAKLVAIHGSRCEIYQEPFEERNLQIDHRIPYEVAGDDDENRGDPSLYMLLSGSANRAKSWSCEHCPNWIEKKDPTICRSCYWAYPDNYDHIAMQPIRRADIMWSDGEVGDYEQLKSEANLQNSSIPDFIKDIIRKVLR
jgi:hypothetical protein